MKTETRCGRNAAWNTAWGARGRWFESSRPDHYFSNQNSKISDATNVEKWRVVLPFSTRFYPVLPMFLGKIWGKFFKADSSGGTAARDATQQGESLSARLESTDPILTEIVRIPQSNTSRKSRQKNLSWSSSEVLHA